MSEVQIVTILKALADTTRLDIVRSISRQKGEVSCSEVSKCSGLSQPAKSHHFKRLVDAGVISEHKRGRQKYYSINQQALLSAGIDIKKL